MAAGSHKPSFRFQNVQKTTGDGHDLHAKSQNISSSFPTVCLLAEAASPMGTDLFDFTKDFVNVSSVSLIPLPPPLSTPLCFPSSSSRCGPPTIGIPAGRGVWQQCAASAWDTSSGTKCFLFPTLINTQKQTLLCKICGSPCLDRLIYGLSLGVVYIGVSVVQYFLFKYCIQLLWFSPVLSVFIPKVQFSLSSLSQDESPVANFSVCDKIFKFTLIKLLVPAQLSQFKPGYTFLTCFFIQVLFWLNLLVLGLVQVYLLQRSFVWLVSFS